MKHKAFAAQVRQPGAKALLYLYRLSYLRFMQKNSLAALLAGLFLLAAPVVAQEQVVYKQIDTISLEMQVYYPEVMDTSLRYPAMVFFFGGGWSHGTISQFEPHARYFAERGMVCFLVDYRVSSRHQTTPFESLKDAKSAIRFVRQQAERFRVDPDRIVASGGSAGGHLAAATALITAYNEESDPLAVSCLPNALVLFNPVMDNGPGGYGYERIGEAFPDFSPLHNIRAGAPPTIIFLGTEDRLIPVETARYYQMVMERTGSRCELYLYDGQGHGFFNASQPAYFQATLKEADLFLQSLHYLSAR